MHAHHEIPYFYNLTTKPVFRKSLERFLLSYYSAGIFNKHFLRPPHVLHSLMSTDDEFCVSSTG